MKDSIFNSKLWLSENILAIYNSLTDKVIVASKNIIDINDLSHSPQQLLQKLASNGFVVEDDYDETSNYIRYVKEIENDTTNAHLIINPTINCNFHCWYCYETHSKSIMTQEIIDRLKKLIARIFSENRRLQISFFGGEPLLYYTKVMLPILEYTKS
uniref:radical SAM protein n=1 Tax=Holdemanella sp. TaxID=1971762 RepID=UPI003AF1ACCC